jgi:hypothetical protein
MKQTPERGVHLAVQTTLEDVTTASFSFSPPPTPWPGWFQVGEKKKLKHSFEIFTCSHTMLSAASANFVTK